eukprot:TRINITY_DN707_c0_g1_i1.p1 TRINITY_DN707_c0_g1~~TRINITY_DN707_c0_g1_i1.p1  ORF type:complete len:122 (-),score=39.13 TRINITY_DN707_c0_g1_i1:534-899(-)
MKALFVLALAALAVCINADCDTGTWKKTVCQVKLGACCCSWTLADYTQTQCMYNATCAQQLGGGTCSDSATCWEGTTVPQECDGENGTSSCCCTYTDSMSGQPTRNCVDQAVCDDLQGTCF